jgi:hypothetical protein
VQQDILGLDIAMEDVAPVGVVERGGDCPGDADRLIDGEMTSWYGSRAIEGLRYLREFRRSFA